MRIQISRQNDSPFQRETIQMLRPLRAHKLTAFTAILTVFLLTAAQALWAMAPQRLLPNGRVKVYRGDQLVSVLSEEAPLPEGVLLAPEGQCGLRLDNLYMVAEDGSRFSIVSGAGGRELMLREGVVYFARSSATGPVAFHTPSGVITTQRLILNASAEGGLLKGYVDAAADGTRIGVLEGGSLVVLTADGEQTIASGRQITLAQADLFDDDRGQGAAEDGPPGAAGEGQAGGEGAAGQAEEEDDDIPAAYFWGGGAALLAAGAVAIGGGGGGGGGDVSPSQ